MNNATCTATGDWNTTTLINNGEEVQALQLYIEINAGQSNGYGDTNGGGMFADSSITAYVREMDSPGDQFPIFPGKIEIDTPNGVISIENEHIAGVDAPDQTRVFYNGPVTNNQLFDVTNGVVSIFVNIDFDANIQQVKLVLYKHHTFSFVWGSDEISDITLL